MAAEPAAVNVVSLPAPCAPERCPPALSRSREELRRCITLAAVQQQECDYLGRIDADVLARAVAQAQQELLLGELDEAVEQVLAEETSPTLRVLAQGADWLDRLRGRLIADPAYGMSDIMVDVIVEAGSQGWWCGLHPHAAKIEMQRCIEARKASKRTGTPHPVDRPMMDELRKVAVDEKRVANEAVMATLLGTEQRVEKATRPNGPLDILNYHVSRSTGPAPGSVAAVSAPAGFLKNVTPEIGRKLLAVIEKSGQPERPRPPSGGGLPGDMQKSAAMVREHQSRMDPNAFRPLRAADVGNEFAKTGVQWHDAPVEIGSRMYRAPRPDWCDKRFSLPSGAVAECAADGFLAFREPPVWGDHSFLITRGFRPVTEAMGNQFVADYQRSRQRGDPDAIGFLERGAAASAIAAGAVPFRENRGEADVMSFLRQRR
jgi:hypothetical protein